MAQQRTHKIGGIEWTCSAIGDLTTFEAEMSEKEYAARSELWTMAAAKGWEVDPVTHADDPEIAPAGRVWVCMRIREAA